MVWNRALAFAALLVVTSAGVQATEAENNVAPARPRIGLVLGGGGAKGAAHIGVLRVLDEMRVPVDCVAGTSMGALIGGTFASGMPPAEIEKAVLGINWSRTVGNEGLRDRTPINRKLSGITYTNSLDLGIKNGTIEAPGGLLKSQDIEDVIRNLVSDARSTRDFDRLPVPFRAVATDMLAGEMVVLGEGDLSVAMRASMAVPGAFSPVVQGDRVMSDGGMMRNLPVDIARELCAEVVIAVSLASPQPKSTELSSAVALAGRSLDVMINANQNAQIATLSGSDVSIVVQMGDIGSTDFQRVPDAIPLGREAALRHEKQLQALALPEAEYLAWRRSVDRAANPEIQLADVRIKGLDRVNEDYVRAQLQNVAPGATVTTAQIEEDTGRIFALGDFERVEDRLSGPGDARILNVGAIEKSWGPDYLQFGMELSDNFEGDSSYNLGVLYTKTAINPLNGELRLGVQIGQDPGLTAEWHQPLDPASRYFVNTKAYLRRDQFSRYDGDDIVSDFNIWRAGLDLAIGREFGTWGEGRVGYRRFKGEADVRIGDPALDDYSFDGGQLYGRLFLDKLDNVYFPTKGNKGILELMTSSKSLGSDSSYDQARLSYSHAFSRGRNNFVGALSFNTTLDDDAPPEALFRTGGFLHLSGFRPNQLSGQHSGLVNLVFYRRITDTKILPAYIGGSIEYGNVWQDSDDIAFDDGLLNGSLFLGADTPVGPAYFGLGLGEGGNNTVFFYLGPAF